MRLTIEQYEAIVAANRVLIELVYSKSCNPVEKMYFSDIRDKLEVVRLMPYGEDK